MKRAAKLACMIAGAAAAALAFAIPARAESVALTEQQTLALYGSQISAQIKPTWNDAITGVTFDYYGFVTSMGYWTDSSHGWDAYHMDGEPQTAAGYLYVDGAHFDTWLMGKGGVVYRASASQWGGGQVRPYGAIGDTAPTAQVHLSTLVSIENVSSIKQYFGISCNKETWSNQRTDARHNLGQYTQRPTFGGVWGGFYQTIPHVFRAALPLSPVNESQGQTTPWATTPKFEMYYYEDSGESFTVGNGLQLTAYWVASAGSENPDLFLVIGCPEIDFAAPPETTTAQTTRPPAGTGQTGVTGIGTTATGVDLTNISADLAEIIRNQRWQISQGEVINENARIIANNTNEIIRILNKIYDIMQESGEIPSEPDGFSLGAVESALQGYTTARIPEQAESGVRFLAALVQFINDELTWAAALGALGLALSVTCWILFRGRNA